MKIPAVGFENTESENSPAYKQKQVLAQRENDHGG